MADLASIRTKVRNISGSTTFFGFLGAHGVSLIDNEYYSFVGDLKSLVAGNARKEKALNNALDGSKLSIVKDPVHIHQDTDNSVRYTLSTAGILAIANLDSGAYDTDTV